MKKITMVKMAGILGTVLQKAQEDEMVVKTDKFHVNILTSDHVCHTENTHLQTAFPYF